MSAIRTIGTATDELPAQPTHEDRLNDAEPGEVERLRLEPRQRPGAPGAAISFVPSTIVNRGRSSARFPRSGTRWPPGEPGATRWHAGMRGLAGSRRRSRNRDGFAPGRAVA